MDFEYCRCHNVQKCEYIEKDDKQTWSALELKYELWPQIEVQGSTNEVIDRREKKNDNITGEQE